MFWETIKVVPTLLLSHEQILRSDVSVLFTRQMLEWCVDTVFAHTLHLPGDKDKNLCPRAKDSEIFLSKDELSFENEKFVKNSQTKIYC